MAALSVQYFGGGAKKEKPRRAASASSPSPHGRVGGDAAGDHEAQAAGPVLGGVEVHGVGAALGELGGDGVLDRGGERPS
jgi:hypothetical protein